MLSINILVFAVLLNIIWLRDAGITEFKIKMFGMFYDNRKIILCLKTNFNNTMSIMSVYTAEPRWLEYKFKAL